MANYMSRLVVSRLLLHFDIELCTEGKDWFAGQKVWGAWDKKPVPVKLNPVQPHPKLVNPL
jgi:hypothetical protein